MDLWMIAAAFADNGQASGAAAFNAWLGPGFVGVVVGALITVVGGFLLTRYKEIKDRKQNQKIQHKALKTDEDRYLDWIINQHRYLNITGLRTRAPVEVELERVYVSLAADPHAL
ncbi:MAG: hypothetical protein GY850_18900, partial [bacterium]|nr:hypothetical protein [bacterium]